MPKAIQCFQEQTYPSRELLILADGADVRDLVPASSRIRLIHIEEGYTIGQKRNFGCSLARGEVIAHWDDDDYSAPGRLERQAMLLAQSAKSVTGYHAMQFTDGNYSWEYRTTDDFALGTSLFYRKSYWKANPFPPLQDGEDTAFVRAAQKQGQLLAVESHGLMTGTIHGGNTHARDLSENYWRKLA